MTKTPTQPWNVVDYLDNPETIASYLEAALEDNDSDFLTQAIGDVLKAKGIYDTAAHAGINCPTLICLNNVLHTLGLKIAIVPSL